MEVTLTTIDGNGRPIRAVVGTEGSPTLIACTRDSLGNWEATHTLDVEGNAGELPSCFSLNGAALAALETAAQEYEDA